jgi:acid phosphatase type 7
MIMFRDNFDDIDNSTQSKELGSVSSDWESLEFQAERDSSNTQTHEHSEVDLAEASLPAKLLQKPQWTPPIQGPWLQSGGSTSQTICWDTTVDCPTELMIGTDQSNMQQVYFDGSPKTQHRVELVGLIPDKQYFYQIRNGALALANHSFYSAPTPNCQEPVRAFVFGDSGRAGSVQQSIISSAKHFDPTTRTQLLVFLGDMAYENGTDAEFTANFFRPYKDLLNGTSFISTPGNHEEQSSSSSLCKGPYYDMAQPPRHGELGGAASSTAAYYSMDFGPIHFISINTTDSVRLDPAQLDWIKSDLANSNAPWKVAIFHHPPYSFGNRNSDKYRDQTEVREQIVPLLEQGGVDVVLSGHSHTAEISSLIHGHYGTSDTFDSSHVMQQPVVNGDTLSYTTSASNSKKGVLYMVAGSASRLDVAMKHPAMAWVSNNPASLVIDANAEKFSARFVSKWGNATQGVSIEKTP